MLPALLAECCERWSLELEKPFENLSYNVVLPGKMGRGSSADDPERTDVVLKLGVPCAELDTEAAALSLFQGDGAVRLLERDTRRGALLLERVTPGTPIHLLQSTENDEETTRTAAILMRRLWRTPPDDHSFPSLGVWFQAFARQRKQLAGGTGPFPFALIANAERTFGELNGSSSHSVLLHGDLHHENILWSAERGWLAIDPKGIVGDPGYEVGPFMLNQLPPGASEMETKEILMRKLGVFSDEFGLSRDRLARWVFCHAVLSAVWDFEEGADWGGTTQLAEILERLGEEFTGNCDH